ncbi:uncharacterized protein LOC110644571 isoform X2 [Hevea brasiliensis]|uniref:uncharacterized protein LOC110644571 isoform X2 n=1 Tax=Hevea brasiliensis TaxID=3981 RepID=UPI0025E57E6C|nr:uncharacterized protein LOC110644571 isoform X2 [Hevea brasiliensis]
MDKSSRFKWISYLQGVTATLTETPSYYRIGSVWVYEGARIFRRARVQPRTSWQRNSSILLALRRSETRAGVERRKVRGERVLFHRGLKMSTEYKDWNEIHDCVLKLRVNPRRRREKVYIGCGAGFGGDRPLAALRLLQRVKELNYLVLECLAERTLADRYQVMVSGGDGYDSRISDWMRLLLPLAVERGTCIITNMGAMDVLHAQESVLEIASNLGLSVSVAVAHEISSNKSGIGSPPMKSNVTEGGVSTYLGAAPIVECLEKYQPNVIITSRIADAALFLAPMVFELGWNWDDLKELAQGSLAGHLLECGCQLTGGYFMHPEISFDGQVCVAKAGGSGGVLNFSTCAQQLLYEVGDPGAYITPDVIIDFQDVSFYPSSSSCILCAGAKPSLGSRPDKLLCLVPKDCGWKGWGEISYGGHECVTRAKAAEYLVRSWMEEVCPGVSCNVVSCIIGLDSLKVSRINDNTSSWTTNGDIRLHMDGLFELKEHAVLFTREFTALYTNGPAGGGGISTGYKKEIVLEKKLVGRECVFWQTGVKSTKGMSSEKEEIGHGNVVKMHVLHEALLPLFPKDNVDSSCVEYSLPVIKTSPAPSGHEIPLYTVAHSRAGDKGNDLNFSIIPHFPPDIERLKMVVTPQWVKGVVAALLNTSSFLDSEAIMKRDKWVNEYVDVEIYEVRGIHSLNVVVRNILDGGVNCSRRIDRHGKTISDVILCQHVVLPP